MFAVIRKMQGRTDVPEKQECSFEANSRHIAKFACKENVQDPHPSVVTLAFGRGSCPKLRRLLDEPEREVDVSSGAVSFNSYIPEAKSFHPGFPKHSEERSELVNVIRQKALYALIEMLHDPINVSEAVTNGLVPSLNARCTDDNSCIREYAVIALGMIAESHLGLEEMCACNSIKVLCDMMNDDDHATRCNVFLSLIKACYTPKGVEVVLAQNRSLEVVIEKARWDDLEVKNLALELMYAILKIQPELEVDRRHHAIKHLALLLEEDEAPLRQWACNNLMCLSILEDGKKLCIVEHSVPLLVKLLQDDESAVRAAAAGALMNITVDNEAKSLVLKHGGAEALMNLLEDTNEVCVLNTVKAIANTTELPDARVVFQACAQRLKDLSESADKNKTLAQQALVAYEAVTWAP